MFSLRKLKKTEACGFSLGADISVPSEVESEAQGRVKGFSGILSFFIINMIQG